MRYSWWWGSCFVWCFICCLIGLEGFTFLWAVFGLFVGRVCLQYILAWVPEKPHMCQWRQAETLGHISFLFYPPYSRWTSAKKTRPPSPYRTAASVLSPHTLHQGWGDSVPLALPQAAIQSLREDPCWLTLLYTRWVQARTQSPSLSPWPLYRQTLQNWALKP